MQPVLNETVVEETEPEPPREFQVRFAFSFSKERDFFTRRPDQYVFFASVTDDEILGQQFETELMIVDYKNYHPLSLQKCDQLLEHTIDSKIFAKELGFDEHEV